MTDGGLTLGGLTLEDFEGTGGFEDFEGFDAPASREAFAGLEGLASRESSIMVSETLFLFKHISDSLW